MTENSHNEFQSLRDRLSAWCQTCLGKNLLAAERTEIGKFLPDLFGYHIVQLGNLGSQDFLTNTKISHKIDLLLTNNEVGDESAASARCVHYQLPIAAESMDVVVLPHLLEFSFDPHPILREMERILIGEGHAIIVGFNPWSLWGIWRAILRWWDNVPWCGKFIGLARIKDWLSLLDFDVLETRYVFFRPPIQNQHIYKKTFLLETIGRNCWPIFGGVYIILAKKRVIPLTPMKMRWRTRRHMIASGVAEPTTRESTES